MEMSPHLVGEEQVGNPHPVWTGQSNEFQSLTVILEAVVMPFLSEGQLSSVDLLTGSGYQSFNYR